MALAEYLMSWAAAGAVAGLLPAFYQRICCSLIFHKQVWYCAHVTQPSMPEDQMNTNVCRRQQ